MAKRKKVATRKEEQQVKAAQKKMDRLLKERLAAEAAGDGKRARRLSIEIDVLLKEIAPR